MSELAIRADTPRTQIESYQNAAVERLAVWADSASAAYTVAEKLVQTSFVPAGFKNKPYEATAAILAGSEVGLSPMASLRSFDVIQGQAAPRAITLRAIVQSFGHQIEVVESTGTRCKMRGKRRDSDTWQTVTWTLDRAKDLQLTSKDNWKKQPQAMLIARATSELARLIAADAILGIGYSVEELVDGTDSVAGAVVEHDTADGSAAPTKRMSRRKPKPVESEAIEGEAVQAEPVEDGITKPQMRMMQALFTEKGFTDRDVKLSFASSLLGIDLTTSNDLTKEQAGRVIDALEDMESAPDEVTPDA